MNTPVSSLLSEKKISLLTVNPSTPVIKAVEMMNKVGVGCVLITEADKLVGIFTERDVLRRVVVKGFDASAVAISEVMTSQLLTISPATEVGQAMDIINEKKLRHLPVLDSGHLVGLISAGDLNRHMTQAFRQEAGTLMSYLSGHGHGI